MRIVKTNKWSLPAYSTLEDQGVELHEAIEAIAKIRLSSNPTLDKVIRIKGKKNTLVLSPNRR